MDLEDAHSFAGKLYDWYWEHGIERESPYSIPVSNWVGKLLRLRDEIGEESRKSDSGRPSIAVWGPSQTGKSTVVSGYLDASANLDPESGEKFGRGAALDWPGTDGEPGSEATLFMVPEIFQKNEEGPPPQLNFLNPFRQGKDASACLSRFIDGQQNPPRYRRFPVEVKLVSLPDLPLILARGYDSECLGPLKNGRQRTWSLDTLVDAIHRAKKGKTFERPNREAVEFLVNFQRIMEAMVFAELPRFAPLEEDGTDEWRTRLTSLQDDLAFTGSLERAEEVAAEILWDGSEKITQAYRGLARVIRKVNELWAGRKVYCDLRVAAILLDMESYQIAYSGPTSSVRDQQIADQLKRLSYRVEDDCILLGLDEDLPERVSLTPFDFGAFQSLVWEVGIPLNSDHLPESKFRDFLAKCDLLDFPGVGRETKNLATRINLGFPEVEVHPDAKLYSDELLFGEIVKRGKTASIVSTFARRGEIDGFNIFSNVDKDPPQKADEIREGVNTWWKSMALEFFKGGKKGRSPLPLNVVLLWWQALVNEASPSSASFMNKVKGFYDLFGEIANPEICSFFAMSYHKFSRGAMDRERIPIFQKRIGEEDEFRRIYGRSETDIGRRSFNAMLEDIETGGAEFFFDQLLQQAEEYLRRRGGTGDLVADRAGELTDLLQWKGLFPDPEPTDSRTVSLKMLIARIGEAVAGRTEDELLELNALLRYLFDVDYTDLDEVDTDPFAITEDFIRRQFTEKWAEKKLQSYEDWTLKGNKAKRNWAPLTFDTKDDLRELLVDGLAGSVEGKFGEICEFMRGLVKYSGHGSRSSRMGDLRRHLAVAMGNLLVYSEVGVAQYTDLGGPQDEEGVLNMDSAEQRGKDCFYYGCYIEPLEDQLDKLLKLPVAARERPTEIPGDKELLALCRDHQHQPFIQTEEGLTTVLSRTDFQTR